VLGHVNQAFARRDVNIASQYLQTEGELGYVVVEADAAPAERAGILAELDRIEGTVRTRLIQARIA
jgi:D-3-phosphoglycerate dehydrogenase